MDEWAPPGFEVEQLLGLGASGEVWRARESATGAVVALQRLHTGGTAERGERLRVRVAAVAALRHAHLVRVRAVHDDGPRPVLVLDHAAGGSLAALLRRRGRLSPGEVVTVGVPLAQALAEAHGAGLVHGGLSATAVLLTDDGMPLLAGLSLADGGTPEGDVRDLLALCRGLLVRAAAPLPGEVPGALAAVLDGGPPASAGELGALLAAAHPATPLGLQADAPGSSLPGARDHVGRAAPPRVRRRRAPRRRRRPGRGVLGLLVLGVLAGAAVALRPAAPPAVDWAQVLGGLDRAREQAFARADPALLAAVHVPGSAPQRSDAAAVATLQEQGRRAEGVRHQLRRVVPLAVAADRVELQVVDVLAAQRVRDARGEVVAQVPGRGERTWTAVLARTPDGWRLAEVDP